MSSILPFYSLIASRRVVRSLANTMQMVMLHGHESDLSRPHVIASSMRELRALADEIEEKNLVTQK